MTSDTEEITMYEKLITSISFNLRFEIMKRGKTIKEVCDVSGLTYVHFAGVVSGDRTTRLETLCKICESIGCDIHDILKPLSFH